MGDFLYLEILKEGYLYIEFYEGLKIIIYFKYLKITSRQILSNKKAHFIMSGLSWIWLSNLGSNQGPAD